jgi:hypothetical protein
MMEHHAKLAEEWVSTIVLGEVVRHQGDQFSHVPIFGGLMNVSLIRCGMADKDWVCAIRLSSGEFRGYGPNRRAAIVEAEKGFAGFCRMVVQLGFT